MRFVRCRACERSYARTARIASFSVNSGSSAPTRPSKRLTGDAAVRCAEQHLERGAEGERGAVGELEAWVGEPDRGAVGQPQVLVDADLEHLCLHGRVERVAVDADLGAGEQWAGDRRHPGISSVRPRSRRSGSSMPLATAISRQRVGSPRYSKASSGRLSPSRTVCDRTRWSARVVGF